MSWKSGELWTKLTGAAALLASTGFFSDMAARPDYAVPGFLFAAMGFFMMLRREPRPQAPPELEQKLEHVAGQLAATQAELAGAQEQIERLRQEGDFMKQLVGGPRAPVPSSPAPEGQRNLPG